MWGIEIKRSHASNVQDAGGPIQAREYTGQVLYWENA